MTPKAAPRGTMNLADATAWTWVDDAACRTEPTVLFFESDPDTAKAVCATCPEAVRRTCLDYALTKPEQYGVWGGFDEDERATERRRRQRGSEPRYVHEHKVTPTPRPPRTTQVDPWTTPDGSTRRLRALVAAGHRADVVVKETGLSKPALVNLRHGHTTRVRTSTARLVADTYARLVELDPGEGAEKCRREAASRGWLLPGAWVGVDIDDPDARPRETATAA